jgi:hypothetical protein
MPSLKDHNCKIIQQQVDVALPLESNGRTLAVLTSRILKLTPDEQVSMYEKDGDE